MYLYSFLLFLFYFLLDFGRIPSGQAIHLYLFLPLNKTYILKLLGKKKDTAPILCARSNFRVVYLSWTHKSVSIKVNHMFRKINNPYFSFPSNICCMFFKFRKIRKCRNKYFTSITIYKQFF